MSIITKLKNIRREIKDIWTATGTSPSELSNIRHELNLVKQESERIAMQLGAMQVERVKKLGEIDSLAEAEFKVFSQFGQDGILQYLIHNIEIPHKIFVEFGVQTYFESTTRFLLMHDRWSGMVMDGDQSYMDALSSTDIYWQYDLTSQHAFITTENINQLISDYTSESDIGVLVVDIDGNDYWIWKAINVIQPRIVVCEYNALFGKEKSITVPYDPEFVNPDFAHYGVSLKAAIELGEEKGYVFVGCNTAGNDAFFVRKDAFKAPLKAKTLEEGFVKPKFRGSHNRDNWESKLPLFDLETGKIIKPAPKTAAKPKPKTKAKSKKK